MKLTFEKLGEKVEICINGHHLLFSQGTIQMATIDGLRLDYDGVVKEYPNLKDDKEWRIKAIENFKNKIKELDTEKEVAQYVIKDLKKHDYELTNAQKDGFRAIKKL